MIPKDWAYDGDLLPDCDYTNCHAPYFALVEGKRLCREHAKGYREFLKANPGPPA